LCCLRDQSFLGSTASLTVNIAAELFLFLLLFLRLIDVMSGPGAVVVQRSVLSRQVMATFISGSDVVAAALGQGAGAGGELGGHGCVGGDPVCERILAVLDDGSTSLISVVGLSRLAGSDGRVVNELEQVFTVAGNDGDLFRVLSKSVELVRVGCLDLLAGNVGELSLGNEGLGFGADKLLLQDNNLGRVGLLVLELSNLIRDLLFAWCALAWVNFNTFGGNGCCGLRSRLGWTEASMLRMLFMVIRYWS
jgi:hypothetical protein